MYIDAHQHFWRYHPDEYAWIDDSMAALRRDFLPSDLEPELRRNGFQGCVAVQTRQSLDETEWLLDLAARAPFIVGVVGWVDLRSLQLRSQLELFASNLKFVGLRHIVQSEPDDRFLLHPSFLRGVGMLQEFGLGYDILIYPRHLPVALEFARRFPEQRFVLDHVAKPAIRTGDFQEWAEGIRELATLSNVWCKLSGLVTEADWSRWKPEQIRPCLDVAFECFGPDRLMVGSDWPVCLVAATYSRVIELVADYLKPFPAEVRDAVMGGNAQKFWHLKM
jgi:L-fuconolactonase